MEKLPMCRICLVENVRMCIIVDKDLRELYETLTNIPFVTEDKRPALACFFCFVKLKQCWQLQRKCLEAEELFAQMMNEPYPSVNRGQRKCFSGLTVTPVENISIVGVSHIESVAVKEELPAIFERLDDDIEPEEEHQSDDVEHMDYSDVEDIPALHYSKLGYDLPLIELKTEVEEQEVSREKRRAGDTTHLELELLKSSYSDAEITPAQQSESDSEYDVPLIEIKTEVEEEKEASRQKRRASDTTRSAVAKKPKLYIRGKKLEDVITENRKKNEESVTKVTQNTRSGSSKLIPKFQEPLTNTTPRVNISVSDTTSDTNCRNNIKRRNSMKVRGHTGVKLFKCVICQTCFNRKDVLTRHIRTHTNEKPYKCKDCQLCFKEKGNLTRHIRTHTGEKPFKCEECQRCFNDKRDLTRHIRTHTGELPYVCKECQRCFIEKSHLTKHIRTHTGEKPYKCEECQRCFSMKHHLTRHIRTYSNCTRHRGKTQQKKIIQNKF